MTASSSKPASLKELGNSYILQASVDAVNPVVSPNLMKSPASWNPPERSTSPVPFGSRMARFWVMKACDMFTPVAAVGSSLMC